MRLSASFKSCWGQAKQWAGLVDHVSKGERCRKVDQVIELQPQWIKAPDVFAFLRQFVAPKQQSKFGFDHRVMSQVGHAQHERRKTIKRCNHGDVTEHDPGSRSRETDKDQTGHDRQTEEADHDFKRGDAMAVKSVRVGVPIAYGGQRFYAEEEGVGKRSRRQFSDASPSEEVERCEAEVNKR